MLSSALDPVFFYHITGKDFLFTFIFLQGLSEYFRLDALNAERIEPNDLGRVNLWKIDQDFVLKYTFVSIKRGHERPSALFESSTA